MKAASMGSQCPTDASLSPSGDESCRTAPLLPEGRLTQPVSELIDVTLLTDEELQKRITTCGMQMLAAHALGMKEERRRWLSEEERALRERNRRPHLVAAREAELGLTPVRGDVA